MRTGAFALKNGYQMERFEAMLLTGSLRLTPDHGPIDGRQALTAPHAVQRLGVLDPLDNARLPFVGTSAWTPRPRAA